MRLLQTCHIYRVPMRVFFHGRDRFDDATKYAAANVDACNRRPERCDRIALVLQGGGALGAYQAGVYQALHEADIEPDWVSGVSIGAINSAIIAGNPQAAAARSACARSGSASPSARSGTTRRTATCSARRATPTSSWLTMMQGQPGFFTPRFPSPWMSFAGATHRDQLLRQRAAARDAGGAGRFFADQRAGRCASRSAPSTC